MRKLVLDGNLWIHEVSHKEALEELQRKNVALLADLQDAERTRTLLLQALRFYAEQASYASSWTVGNKCHVMEDQGKVANNALELVL